MRTTRKTILAMAGASVLAITNAQAQNEVRSEQSPDELRGDWVIGKTVRSMDDEVIGTITDILIDESDGRVTSAVIDVGGFLG
ncbi:MAG: PRC-barrel domain-containing protein, partial [Pseudomonadota bacterium]